MSISVRTATLSDAAAIRAIYAPMVADTAISFEDEPPSAAEMALRIAETLAGFPYLVATDGDRVAGYAYAGPHRERSAYRFSVDVTIYVARDTHRRGVGRALYGVLLPDLARRGFHAAFTMSAGGRSCCKMRRATHLASRWHPSHGDCEVDRYVRATAARNPCHGAHAAAAGPAGGYGRDLRVRQQPDRDPIHGVVARDLARCIGSGRAEHAQLG